MKITFGNYIHENELSDVVVRLTQTELRTLRERGEVQYSQHPADVAGVAKPITITLRVVGR